MVRWLRIIAIHGCYVMVTGPRFNNFEICGKQKKKKKKKQQIKKRNNFVDIFSRQCRLK